MAFVGETKDNIDDWINLMGDIIDCLLDKASLMILSFLLSDFHLFLLMKVVLFLMGTLCPPFCLLPLHLIYPVFPRLRLGWETSILLVFHGERAPPLVLGD